MKTVFKSGPGWFWAETSDHNKKIKKGKMLVHCVIFETYELDAENEIDLDTEFQVLPSMSENSKDLQNRLLSLLNVLANNHDNMKNAKPKK